MMFKCRTKYSDRLFFLHTISFVTYLIRLFVGFLSCIFSYDYLAKFYDRFVSSERKSKYVTIACGRKHYKGETLCVHTFFPLKEVLFDGVKSYVPNDVDLYLKNLYGDNYMSIPPENKREPHACVRLNI